MSLPLPLPVAVAILALPLVAWCADAPAPKPNPMTDDHVGRLAEELKPARKVVYKKVADRELQLHIFQPKGWKATDRRACFITIHGGGWTGGEPKRMYPFADHYAKLGLVGISVQYRLFNSKLNTTVFDCVKDARSALRHVRAHAADLGIDPGKIIVSGGSAGGHLAVATASFDGVDEAGEDVAVSCAPNALVLLFPVIDTSTEGYGHAKLGERWEALSPAHQVRAGLPPTITFHGTGDTVTPFRGAKLFHDAMLKAGNRSELVINEGGAHGYLMRTGPLYEECLQKSDAFLATLGFVKAAAGGPLTFKDPTPQRYELTARASGIDPRAKAHPEIDFIFEKGGKPADVENASVDTRVKPQGKLVIWLMGYSAPLFERINSYGIHAIRVHYANGWFGKFGRETPSDAAEFLGKIRLEAATGEDFSPVVNIPKPDGMTERALQFVKHLAKVNPQGRWDYFLNEDKTGLRWDRVIISGSSHGSTTAARFAKHQPVDRVVMFCGPRDQYEPWQALPTATPAKRFFGFSHVLDSGWSGDHYCRSWEMLGLHQFGPIVNVDLSKPPYSNTRRLITDADVKGDAKRAHSSVTPGGSSAKSKDGKFLHEEVWRYLFNQPVEKTGEPVAPDPECEKDLRSAPKK